MFALFFFIILTFFPQINPSIINTDSLSKELPRKKIGLALSGGAAKGFAHIGVLQVLVENNIPIDYISGTSMGAIIGGLYASGYSIDSLETIVRTIQWNDMYFDKVGRLSRFIDQREGIERYSVELPFVNNAIQIPLGVISGQKFYNEMMFYTYPVHPIKDFDKLPIPFRAIATDLSNGKAVVLKSGSLAKSIRASMSLPTILMPVEIDGKKLIDGGIARNLPAQDVKEMGADFVIGVDFGDILPKSDDLNSLFAVLEQTVSYMINNNVAEQYHYCDALIKPEVDALAANAFDSLNTFIELGRKATLSILPELLSEIRTDPNATAPLTRSIPLKTDSLNILTLQINGVSDELKIHIESSFLIKPGIMTTEKKIEEDINRLIGTEFFEDVDFEILPVSNKGYQLTVNVKEKKAEFFNFGFRFDNINRSAFTFNLNLRDRIIKSSQMALTFRAGESYLFDMYYRKFRLIPPRLALSFQLTGISTPLPIYENNNRVGLVNLQSARATMNMNSILSMHSQLGIIVRLEYFNNKKDFGINVPIEKSAFYLVGLNYEYDCLSRIYYPEKGVRFKVSGIATTNEIIHEYRFLQAKSNLDFAIPLAKRLTFNPSFFAGVTLGDSYPNHYQFFAGSPFPSLVLSEQEIPFPGFDERSIQATQLAIGNFNLNYEYAHLKYISLHSGLGLQKTNHNLLIDDAKFLHSFGFSFGFLAPFGPMQLYFLNSNRNGFSFLINIGFRI